MKARLRSFLPRYRPALVILGIAVFAALGLTSTLALAPNARIERQAAAAPQPTAAATRLPSCEPGETPLGALPEQPAPIWCYKDLAKAPATSIEGPNSWLDEFEHGASLATFNDGENG